MLTLDELKARLQPLNTTEVAKAAGVDRGTVLKLKKGKHSPTITTFEKLCVAVKTLSRKQRKAA